MEEAEPTSSPPTFETAMGWLEQSQPAAVLKILRDPDFALIGAAAFAGFRVNAAGYARPLVRQRLALEAARNEKFAEKLQSSAKEPAAATLHHTKASPPPTATKVEIAANSDQMRTESLRTERDRIRRERDQLKVALAEHEAARRDSEKQRHQAEVERDSANEQAQRQTQRIARLERQIAKLRSEKEDINRANRRQSDVESRGQAEARAVATSKAAVQPKSAHAPGNVWADAVARLLDKSHYETAARVAEDVLRGDPDNIDAIEIAARAYAGMESLQRAAPLFRRLLAARLAKGERAEAGEVLLHLLTHAPEEREKDLRTYLHGLRAKDLRAIDQARTLFARLRSLAPEKYAAVSAAIPKLVSKPLAAVLTAPASPSGADAPLTTSLAGNITASFALLAIARGDVGQVTAIRDALERLKQTDMAAHQQARTALEEAAGDDRGALIPILRGKTRGAIIVDGSNVAWHDQESLSHGFPRLQPLLNLRRALRAQGYFPILLLGDANLPHVIDDPATLQEMIKRHEVTLVDSGVDADEVIIRQARQHNAPVVTNDYMDDWDPLNDVQKIRYAISLNGEAMLLPED